MPIESFIKGPRAALASIVTAVLIAALNGRQFRAPELEPRSRATRVTTQDARSRASEPQRKALSTYERGDLNRAAEAAENETPILSQ
jgi:hypothetical protein